MPLKKSDIQHIETFVSTYQQTYTNEMKQVVELFRDRKIETMRDAIQTIELLGSTSKKKHIQGLEILDKHKGHETNIILFR